jgi:hypothetical protein
MTKNAETTKEKREKDVSRRGNIYVESIQVPSVE